MVMSVAVTVIVVVMSLLLLPVVGAKPVKGIVAIVFTVAAFLAVIGVATFVDAIVIKGVMTFDGVVVVGFIVMHVIVGCGCVWCYSR